MTTKNLRKALVLTAFFVGATAFSSAASADFYVELDCVGTNGLPAWSETPDTISLSGKIDGNWTFLVDIPMDNCQDESWVHWNVTYNASDVTALRVSTDGSDALWLDKVILMTGNRDVVASWGIDNNVGYCFSTDSSDGNSAYCYNGVAHRKWVFNR